MTWLNSLILTALKAVGNFFRGWLRDRKAIDDAEARGAAEERERMREGRDKEEAEGRKAAEEAARKPPLEPDEFMRPD